MQLTDYVLVIRKRWWAIALVALVASASTYFYARLQTPIYRSTQKLEVRLAKFDYGNVLAVERLLRALSEGVRTSSIAEQVDQRLRLDLGPESLLKQVKTQHLSDTMQIQIDVDDVDARRAQLLAREFGRVYAESVAADESTKPITERIIVRPLDRPSAPTIYWPQTRVLVLASGIVGLLFGLLLAFLLEYLDDTLKTPEDVERFLSLPTLGVIPTSGGKTEISTSRLPGLGKVTAAGR